MARSPISTLSALLGEMDSLAQEAMPLKSLDSTSAEYKKVYTALFSKVAALTRRLKMENLTEIEGDHSPRNALATIAYCLDEHLAIPDWAPAVLAWFYRGQLEGNYRSWDQVFGKPTTKKRASTGRRDLDSLNKIADMVDSAKANGTPIDNHLFETIGRTLGIGGKSRVIELYSAWCRPPKPRHSRSHLLFYSHCT